MDNSLELYDQELLLKINSLHSDWFDILMWQFSAIYILLPFPLLLLYYYHKRYQMRNVVALVLCAGISIAFTDLTSNAVKHMVKRYRPTHNLILKEKIHLVKDSNGKEYRGGKYGFFSAHAANTIGVTTLLFFAASWIHKKRRIFFYLVPAVIIYSRMYVGAHYPSDVLIGTIDGLIFGYLSFLIFRKYFFKSPLVHE
jgi:undecaprenyl-diphosphatase